MNKLFKIIKLISFIGCVLLISFIIYKDGQISSLYNIPKEIISGLSILTILFVSCSCIILYFKMNKLDYEFTSIVNHVFRTPLTSIMWSTEELKKELTLNDKLLYLQKIRNSTNKIINVVDIVVGIKNINNRSGYVFKATSIRDIIEKSIKKCREEIIKKNIKFQVSSFKNIPLLTVDLNKITFVVDTLVENAIFYTPRDGKILIDSIWNKDGIIFYIADTGIGLTFIEKMRIFSKFYRSYDAKLMNTDGLGLRLYLSKQIVKRHNGSIYAKSNGRNKGSTFFVELPMKN